MTKISDYLSKEQRIKYAVPSHKAGEHHMGINYCPKCQHTVRIFDEQVGFTHTNAGFMTVVECPECLTRWHFHAVHPLNGTDAYSHIACFLDAIADGTNRHYPKKVG